MSFLWGYVGILSFGQTAFFGLGGYAYAVLGLNMGSTTLPLPRRHPAAHAAAPPCSATS
jgi:branched-chain amino acid transport system permease protein